jgi:hypothetical protein
VVGRGLLTLPAHFSPPVRLNQYLIHPSQELYRDVCKMANALKAHGVKKGDVVMIYMPMVRTQRHGIALVGGKGGGGG